MTGNEPLNPTTDDVRKALALGWEIRHGYLVNGTDLSTRWAAEWLPLLYGGETLYVPHWLRQRLKVLEHQK